MKKRTYIRRDHTTKKDNSQKDIDNWLEVPSSSIIRMTRYAFIVAWVACKCKDIFPTLISMSMLLENSLFPLRIRSELSLWLKGWKNKKYLKNWRDKILYAFEIEKRNIRCINTCREKICELLQMQFFEEILSFSFFLKLNVSLIPFQKNVTSKKK